MTRYYRRTSPGPRENMGAGAVALGLAAGVAAVTFYLVRLMLTRAPLDPPELEGPADAPLPDSGSDQGG